MKEKTKAIICSVFLLAFGGISKYLSYTLYEIVELSSVPKPVNIADALNLFGVILILIGIAYFIICRKDAKRIDSRNG